jgi:carnosine N-methyltransferase
MLLASDFILNGPTNSETKLSISPWLLETRNVHAPTDPLRTVHIPDVDPFEMVYSPIITTSNGSAATSAEATQSTNDIKPRNDFSMVAGDFVSVYNVDTEKEQWDGVVACFFLDASPVIIEYLQVIHYMLKEGGYLIHFGPLLWHFSGPPMSLEDATIQDYQKRYSSMDPKFLSAVDFTWDDVLQILVNIGFEIVQCVKNIPALYTADRNSMLYSQYQCIHLVARKRQMEM